MLILRRRVGETILVNGDVEIEVIEISRNRVRLGIRAPRDVPVIRKETLVVARENRLASDLMAATGRETVGELLRLLKQPAPDDNPDIRSNDPSGSRYVTSDHYSGYRNHGENPHPA